MFCVICFQSGYTLAVINIGAPAGGMSTAARSFVRSALYQGHSVLGIRDGIDGLLQDKVFSCFPHSDTFFKSMCLCVPYILSFRSLVSNKRPSQIGIFR